MADYLGMGEETGFPAQVLSQQAAKAQIAHQQASTQYINQLARHSSIQADEAQLDYDADKQVAEMNKLSMESNPQEEPMDTLTRDATILIRNGRPARGLALLKGAGEIINNETKAAARAMDANTRRTAQQMKTLGVMEQALANANSPETWKQALDAIVTADPGSKSLVAQMGDYSPEKAAYYQNLVVSKKDQLRIAAEERRNDIADRVQKSNEAWHKAQEDARQQEIDIKKQAEARRAKAGGKAGAKPVGMVGKEEVTGVKDILDGQNIEYTEEEASGIAQEARARYRANPGMTPQEAAYRVIAEKLQAKDIKPTVKGEHWYNRDQKGKIVASASKPLPLPSDPSAMVKGQYYINSKGQIGKSLGGGKVAIVGSKGEEALPETPDEDEEE